MINNPEQVSDQKKKLPILFNVLIWCNTIDDDFDGWINISPAMQGLIASNAP